MLIHPGAFFFSSTEEKLHTPVYPRANGVKYAHSVKLTVC